MEEIIDYVMNSPENTNKAILRQKLSSVGGTEPDMVLELVRTDGDKVSIEEFTSFDRNNYKLALKSGSLEKCIELIRNKQVPKIKMLAITYYTTESNGKLYEWDGNFEMDCTIAFYGSSIVLGAKGNFCVSYYMHYDIYMSFSINVDNFEHNSCLNAKTININMSST